MLGACVGFTPVVLVGGIGVGYRWNVVELYESKSFFPYWFCSGGGEFVPAASRWCRVV